jgi:hypothetical protein
MLKRFSLIILALMLSCTSLMAASKVDTIRVAFIGNSYTYFNEMPKLVQELANGVAGSNKRYVDYKQFTPPGCALKLHVKNDELIKSLKHDKWDYVVVQEQSEAPSVHTADVAKETYPYAAQICKYAREGNPDVKIIFYMTWGHKDGTSTPVEGYPLPDSYAGMQLRLMTSYLEMAYDNNAWCAPVGMAWQKVRTERPNLQLYMADRSHPSLAGSYLAANVIYTTIIQSGYQSQFNSTLDPELAEYLQQMAQRTVLDNLTLINIKR